MQASRLLMKPLSVLPRTAARTTRVPALAPAAAAAAACRRPTTVEVFPSSRRLVREEVIVGTTNNNILVTTTRRRRGIITAAEGGTEGGEGGVDRGGGAPSGGGGGGDDDDDETAMSGLARRLVERKYNPEGAKQVLETFDKLGIENEEQLQRFFAEVSLPQLGGQVGQIVIVGLSAWAALYVQSAVRNDPDIGGPIGVLLYFGLGVTGLTLTLECITSSLLLAGAISTTVIWGLNPKAFFAAVRASAGDLATTGLGAVDRAAELAKAVGVAQSMIELQGALGAKLNKTGAGAGAGADGGKGGGGGQTVDKLGAMLTLSKAKDEYGFDAARAGLTAEEAADLASTFARFDRTGSGKLNSGDLYDLVWRCESSVF